MTLRKILLKIPVLVFLLVLLFSCDQSDSPVSINHDSESVSIIAAMKDVMWKGELQAKIQFDSLSDKSGLYGLGPLAYLKGEIMILDDKCYVSRVGDDGEVMVEKNWKVGAPFFVYSRVENWTSESLPSEVKTISELEKYIAQKAKQVNRPFAFRLEGKINRASIHIQNLAEGTEVSSPKEAHAGQVKYMLSDRRVEILGFYSTEHHGIFTHHDSDFHLHLLTEEEDYMGHVDELEIAEMTLFLPARDNLIN